MSADFDSPEMRAALKADQAKLEALGMVPSRAPQEVDLMAALIASQKVAPPVVQGSVSTDQPLYAPAPCPYVRTSPEGTAYCRLAETVPSRAPLSEEQWKQIYERINDCQHVVEGEVICLACIKDALAAHLPSGEVEGRPSAEAQLQAIRGMLPESTRYSSVPLVELVYEALRGAAPSAARDLLQKVLVVAEDLRQATPPLHTIIGPDLLTEIEKYLLATEPGP